MDDVLLAKAAIIERCLLRIHQEYDGHEAELETNFTRQDALMLNLQRACEAAIDGAMHLVRIKRLGIPMESRQAFSLLVSGQVITAAWASPWKAWWGSGTSPSTTTGKSTWTSSATSSPSGWMTSWLSPG